MRDIVDRLERVSLDLGMPSTTVIDSAAIREAISEIRMLRKSNDALTRRLYSEADPMFPPMVHHLFGRKLEDVARIIDEHELRLPEPLPNTSDAG